MKPKSCLFFKVLYLNFHQKLEPAAIASLPDDEVQQVLDQSIQNTNPKAALKPKEELLKSIHYSWLAPIIQKLSPSLQAQALASLSLEQSSGVQRLLKTGITIPESHSFLRKYVSHLITAQLIPGDLLPLEYLPLSDMRVLTSCSKGILIEMIDLLGLYDLADSVRQMVNTSKLKNVYHCLTLKEQQFLRICLHQKEKLVIPGIKLKKWSGDTQDLHKLIHEKGLFRLGNALSGQHQGLIWYITHILDVGRAAVLQRYIKANEAPGVTSILQSQVISVLNFLVEDMK